MTEVQNQGISTETTPVVDTQPAAVQTIAQETTSDAQVTTTWLDSLSDELKQSRPLQNFKSPEDLAKSYVNLNSLLGKRYQDMSAEELHKVQSILGKPESQDKYVFPEGLREDQDKWLRETAYNNGLSQDQTKQIADSLILKNREIETNRIAESNVKYDIAVQELKQEFGAAYDTRLEMAKRALVAFGGEELTNVLKESGLDNNPKLVKAFAQIGTKLLADKIVDADKSTLFGTTPDDAKRQWEQKLATPEFRTAYYSSVHPGHAAAVDEANRLRELMYSRG